VPINIILLNPLEDCHACELSAPSRQIALQSPVGQGLSETIVFGMPRSAITLSSSRATQCPDSDVSATRTKFSRLKSSTTAKMRNLRPSVSASDTKSELQRWFGPSGSTIGFLVPKARFLPPLRRT
jgi:hypothetical protein